MIENDLIAKAAEDFGVYEERSFKKGLFARFLNRYQVSWPMLSRGIRSIHL